MTGIDAFMLGCIAMASLTASIFFLRFWKVTGDSLFLWFSISFLLEAAGRTALAIIGRAASEGDPTIYVIRLIAYVLILVAIMQKNMGPKDKS